MLKEMREASGLSQNELAKQIGVSERTIRNYEQDEDSIQIGVYRKIVSVLSLSSNADVQQSKIMSINVSSNPQKMSSNMSSMSPNIQKPQSVLVPVYDEVVASAGSGRFNEDFKAFSVEFDKASLKRLFALANVDNLVIIRASGDSMTPTLPPNARLLLQFRHEFKEGQIVACRLDDELFVKRLHKQPRLRLVSDNKDFEPIELGGKDYELIGVIVGFIKAFEL